MMKAPNSNIQAPEKHQHPSTNGMRQGKRNRWRLAEGQPFLELEDWCLKFLWGLVFGAWCFSSFAVLPSDCTQAVLDNPGFQEGLIWIGTNAPSDSESCALYSILTNLDQTTWTADIEQFLSDHPASPWAASVHHAYASFCRRSGRITKALDHWQSAWALASTNTDDSALRVGGMILGSWGELLTSLGRVETLAGYVTAGNQWQFISSQDYTRFKDAENAYLMMLNHPETAYRCGTYALKAVGQSVQRTNTSLEDLVQIPCPTNGFSVSNLLALGAQRSLSLVAVRRPPEDTSLIVPSVIHWAQNHYAAILDQDTNNNVLVSDPTFESLTWFSGDVVNQEASGVFIVPTSLQPTNWTELSGVDKTTIRGRGNPNTIQNGKDKGCKNPGPPPCPCKDAKGAPQFFVTEPYVDLWLSDAPSSYFTSRGEPFTFSLSYKQRDTRPSNLTNSPMDQIGVTGWNHSWYSYVRLKSALPCQAGGCRFPAFSVCNATLFLPNGGEVSYLIGQRYDQETQTLLGQVNPISTLNGSGDNGEQGVKVVHADGSQDIYGAGYSPSLLPANDYAFTDYVLTRHVDPHGNVTRLYYETASIGIPVTRLKYVVDYDGRTNTLFYTNYNSTGTWLAQVQNPYGVSVFMKYDARGNMTNIVDAAGLSSSITYGTNGYPLTLITPYGTNFFEITDNQPGDTNNFGGHDLIDRAVKVTEPGGATSLYLYRYESSFMPSNWPASEVPTDTPLGTLDDGSVAGSNVFYTVQYRNSFSWNPRQYAALSTTNFSSFNTNDYVRGRMRHWLQDTNELLLSGLISMERDPSPDGTAEGLKVFYDYQGKIFRHRQGTNDLYSVVAWRLPGGETHFEYRRFDDFGNVTNYVTTYSKSDGSMGTRTNQFLYARNYYTNTWTYVSVKPPATFVDAIPDLLTNIVAPDGSNVWSCGGFETVSWTNTFKVSADTNQVVTTSKRILPRYVTNAVNEVTELSFVGSNKLARIKWSSGLTTTNLFDSSGFLSKTIDLEIARTNSFGAYGTNGLPGAFTNELGLSVSALWDGLLRLTSLGFPDSSTISNRYSKLDLTARKDRLGNWSYFGFDNQDHLINFTNANTNVTRFGWCGCGSLETISNALNQVTTFVHDNQLNLTDILFPDTSSVSYRHDLAGRVTNILDGAGRSLTITYNNQGLISAVSNSVGRMEFVVYDVRDHPIQVTDANGISHTNTFDSLDRPLAVSWPGGGTEGFLWSTNGLLAYTNQDHKVTWFGRDVAGRLMAATNANNELVRVLRNPAGQITDLWDGNTNHRVFNLNEYGLLTNKLDGVGHEILRLAYDANLRVTNRWTPEFGNTAFTRDPVGNLKVIQYPASSIQYLYNAVNQLTNMVDQVGTIKFAWTSAGQLASEDGPWDNDTVSYGYTQRLRTSMSLGSLGWTYGYDSAWRMQSLDSPAGSFGYKYPASGIQYRVSGITFPNGASVTNHFDTLARLDYTALVNRWGHVLDGYGYTHDPLGLRTNIVRDFGLAASSVSLNYDDIGQLTSWSAKEQSGSPRLNEQFGWGFDKAHNLQSRTNGFLVQTFNNDAANELTNIFRIGSLTLSGASPAPATNVTVNAVAAERYADFSFARTNLALADGNNTFTNIAQSTNGASLTNLLTVNLPESVNLRFDSNGNLTNDGSRIFLYDPDNQLTNTFLPGAWKTEWVYDGLHRRRIQRDYAWTGAWTKTNETHFVCDGLLAIQERNETNGVLVTYTRGLDFSGSFSGAGGIGGLLARTDGLGNSAFYHADGAGNVTALMNGVGDISARYLYNPFGKMTAQWGPMADANRYRFSSKEVHAASGLYYYGFRFYDPNLQRWLSRDPLGEAGGINLYGFAHNSPHRWADAYGLTGGVEADPETEPIREITAEILRDLRNGRAETPEERLEEEIEQDFSREALRRRGLDPEKEYLDDPDPPSGPPLSREELNKQLADQAARSLKESPCRTVVRYVGPKEAEAARQTGFIPNVDAQGKPKVVFVTPDELDFDPAKIETTYQVGAENPTGPTPTPTHAVMGDASSTSFINGGNVEGGTGSELMTYNQIPVMIVIPLRSGK